MGEFLIRKIQPEDFLAVTTLLAELGRPAPTAETEANLEKVYQQYVANDRQHALIAYSDDQAIGFLSLELRDRLNWPSFEAWIPDFIVTQTVRGTGAGHALFAEAVAIAQAYQCHRLVLESGYAREVAHHFYEAHGMRNSGYYFTLSP